MAFDPSLARNTANGQPCQMALATGQTYPLPLPHLGGDRHETVIAAEVAMAEAFEAAQRAIDAYLSVGLNPRNWLAEGGIEQHAALGDSLGEVERALRKGALHARARAHVLQAEARR